MTAYELRHSTSAGIGVHAYFSLRKSPNCPSGSTRGISQGLMISSKLTMPIVAIRFDDEPDIFKNKIRLEAAKHRFMHFKGKAPTLKFSVKNLFNRGHACRKVLSQSQFAQMSFRLLRMSVSEMSASSIGMKMNRKGFTFIKLLQTSLPQRFSGFLRMTVTCVPASFFVNRSHALVIFWVSPTLCQGMRTFFSRLKRLKLSAQTFSVATFHFLRPFTSPFFSPFHISIITPDSLALWSANPATVSEPTMRWS